MGNPTAASDTDFLAQVATSARHGFRLVETLVDQWQLDPEHASGLSNLTRGTLDGIFVQNPKALVILRPTISPDVEYAVTVIKFLLRRLGKKSVSGRANGIAGATPSPATLSVVAYLRSYLLCKVCKDNSSVRRVAGFPTPAAPNWLNRAKVVAQF